MSDTPRMDSALRKAQEDCTESYLLTEGLKLERELNAANAIIKQQQLLEQENDAANAEIERLSNKVAQLYRGAEEQNQRIKRLEEAGDLLYEGWIGYGFTKDKHLAAWRKAKEAKL